MQYNSANNEKEGMGIPTGIKDYYPTLKILIHKLLKLNMT